MKLTLGDLLSFLVYVVLFLNVDGSEEGANPSNETLFSIMKEFDIRVHLLVNSGRKFDAQLHRQLLNELLHVLRVLCAIILHGLDYSVEEVRVDVVFIFDCLKGRHLVLEFGFRGVLARYYRGDGTCSEGKGNDTDEHE